MIELAAGADLQAHLDRATGGDVLVLGTGDYAGFALSGRRFSAEKPLIVRAAPGARPVIRRGSYTGYLAKLTDVSFLVLEGLTLEGSNQPIYATNVDHILLLDLEIQNTGQEAIHIRGASHHVDIIGCTISDTGHTEPQWAEGIYLGMGNPPFEFVEHVWIEGNEIHHTRHSEAINLKSRVYHVTIRNNHIHDIEPGTATQHNEAAISCEAADRTFRPGEDPDIWIERNRIHDVRLGRWASGIKISTAGGHVVENVIHDCAQFGIAFNAYDHGPGAFAAVLHHNTIERCGLGALGPSEMPFAERDPGPNPNRPQDWYRRAAAP
ncbi:MAG: right-handed parallel beta-helix repeat-containing protein [Opitutaceae bacterium]|nr:right-handed parallel beta-helix repeat-containing protein [Opitutaceae bacterium]